MTDMTTNDRGIGDNLQNIDQAQIVADRLGLDYFESIKRLNELLEDARQLPVKVSSDDMAVSLGAVIKNLRDQDKKLEGFREAEKQPFLRGCDAVDNFFFGLRDKIARRKKGDRSVKPGAIDVLQARIDAWQDEKNAIERARLEAERAEMARLAAIEAALLRKLQEEAQEAERALARARSEASKAERAAEAAEAARKRAQAQAEAEMAAVQAEEARLATLVKTADITRVRGNDETGGGVMLTTRQEPYAMLVDRQLLDLNALRPFFTDAELEKALRGWAKSTGHKIQMAGAEIGFRNRGVTR
jgi:hypothetical protein